MNNFIKFIEKVFDNNRLLITLLIVMIACVILLYFNDYFITKYKVDEIIHLYSFDVINKTLNYALSVLTVILLYLNFKLQQKELKNISDANKDLIRANDSIVKSNERANELQIILNAKDKIDDYINEDFIMVTNQLNLIFSNYESSLNKDPKAPDYYHLEQLKEVFEYLDTKKTFYFLSSLNRINNRVGTLKKIINDNNNLKIISGSFEDNFIHVIKFVNAWIKEDSLNEIIDKTNLDNKSKIFFQKRILKIISNIRSQPNLYELLKNF